MNKYETLFIVKPDQTDDEIQAILDRLARGIESSQGKLAAIDHWGSRRLAYPVRYRGDRLVRGYYLLLTYLGDGRVVEEVERNIKIIDQSFRYLTVKQADGVTPDEVTEVVVTRARETPPEPETLEPEPVEQTGEVEAAESEPAEQIGEAEAVEPSAVGEGGVEESQEESGSAEQDEDRSEPSADDSDKDSDDDSEEDKDEDSDKDKE